MTRNFLELGEWFLECREGSLRQSAVATMQDGRMVCPTPEKALAARPELGPAGMIGFKLFTHNVRATLVIPEGAVPDHFRRVTGAGGRTVGLEFWIGWKLNAIDYDYTSIDARTGAVRYHVDPAAQR